MTQEVDQEELISVRRVSKRFPGVKALSDVDLTLKHGEVLSVIGENGAGKSTLMKILAGVQTPDEGWVEVDGEPVSIESVEQALELGIALIHQELNLAGNLDIGANIFLGREPRRLGFIDRGRIRSESKQLLEMVGLRVSPDRIAGELSIGQQQLVEIAKALSTNARVLIMDEPTSSLSQHEADQLYRVVDRLREQGVSIVYISHRLGEVQRLSDRVVVLRDGENAGLLERDEITHDAMVRMMVGRDVSQFFSREAHQAGETCLAVSGLVTTAFPKHKIDLEVRKGEIVGVAGLVGAGRTEMIRALFGVDPRLGGSITIDGQQLSRRDNMETIDAGMALVPEDRKNEGLVLEMSVRENIGLAGLKRFSRLSTWLSFASEQQQAQDAKKQLRIKTPSLEQPVLYLSGGNQQKVVLGKWLTLQPKLLLLDEPTRGIDIGAKQEIYQLMHRLAGAGMAILFVSSEMEEILGVADRAIVMHEGRITGTLERHEMSEEAVMTLATGQSLAVS